MRTSVFFNHLYLMLRPRSCYHLANGSFKQSFRLRDVTDKKKYLCMLFLHINLNMKLCPEDFPVVEKPSERLGTI